MTSRLALLAVLLSLLPSCLRGQEMHTDDAIVVERVIVDARVTLAGGEPVLGLTAQNFHVRIDGKPADVESADWIAESSIATVRGMAEAGVTETSHVGPSGRLFVLLIQRDFAQNPLRMSGVVKINAMAETLFGLFEPGDRVAVLSYDSRLKLRLDFSEDLAAVRRAMNESLHADEPRPFVPAGGISLASHLSKEAMDNAGEPEKALLALGQPLRQIPGPKSLIFFGWGVGYYFMGRTHDTPDFVPAVLMLQQARTTVFSLDVTQADGHSLAAGLQAVALSTGGFYASTFALSPLAFKRLRNTLSGHYELEVRVPSNRRRGGHAIDVDVDRRGVRVLARSAFYDQKR